MINQEIKRNSIRQMRQIRMEKIFEKFFRYFEVVVPQTPINSTQSFVHYLEQNGRIDEYGNLLNSQGKIVNVA